MHEAERSPEPRPTTLTRAHSPAGKERLELTPADPQRPTARPFGDRQARLLRPPARWWGRLAVVLLIPYVLWRRQGTSS